MTETATKAKLGDITIRVVPDESPDASYLEQEDMGFEERLEAYRAGEFGFVGVLVRAEVKIPYGHDWIMTHVDSPGLWGIKNDSGDDYFRSVADDELDILRDMLASLGIDMGTVDASSLDIR